MKFVIFGISLLICIVLNKNLKVGKQIATPVLIAPNADMPRQEVTTIIRRQPTFVSRWHKGYPLQEREGPTVSFQRANDDNLRDFEGYVKSPEMVGCFINRSSYGFPSE